MLPLTKAVTITLNYFGEQAVRRYPPADEPMISQAERRLGITFPPSLREFLLLHNGLDLVDHCVLGVAAPDRQENQENIVEETHYQRQTWERQDWVVVCRDGSGDVYVLLTGNTDERGEHPVAKIDHENGHIMSVVASCYERFLWFLLDNLKRQFKPDGETKNYRWDALPWPYKNETWMFQHDPPLAQARIENPKAS